jgi:RNA polymerase sigma factor (TIGR02999 family)
MLDPGITGLLHAWRQGDERAFETVLPLVYDELRRIARRQLGRERAGHTLEPTALVNEVYLRLVDARQVEWKDRLHFFAIASRIMRRVLVDAARARQAGKRGGGVAMVPLEESDVRSAERAADLLALDDALESLAVLDARKGRVVELRVFAGLSLDETAAALGVSADTVTRDWKFATSWLRRELTSGTDG